MSTLLRTLLVYLPFSFAILASVGHTQEKPDWIASPSVIYQQNKSYPTTINIRLFYTKCQRDSQGTIVGGKLTGNYILTVTGTGVTASSPVVGDCSLSSTLTITSAAQPGLQVINISDDKKKDFGYASLGFMDATAGPTPDQPEVDVLWEVFTDHLCKDNFGNHMPSDLYCIDVKIGNNSGHALQLAGLGFMRKSLLCKDALSKTQPCTGELGDIATPNVSYQTARASADIGRTQTARNILVNSTQAIGLLMASFTPYFKNTSHQNRWSTASAIVGTTLTQAINLVAPDLTIRELNNLDDQAFRDGKLIPNNTQVRLLVFVQKSSIAEAIGEVIPQIKAAQEVPCSSPVQIGYEKDPQQQGQCYPSWQNSFKKCLSKLECNPVVVKLALGRMIIVGDKIDFIQRIVVDSGVTSQEVPIPVSLSLTDANLSLSPAAGTPVGTLKGTNLQNADKVNIACTDPKDATKSITASDVNNIKSTTNQLTFDLPTGKTLTGGMLCTVTVISKAGETKTITSTPK